MVATLRYRRLIRTGPGQSGANVTTESLKSRRHTASAADGPYLLGAPKRRLPPLTPEKPTPTGRGSPCPPVTVVAFVTTTPTDAALPDRRRRYHRRRRLADKSRPPLPVLDKRERIDRVVGALRSRGIVRVRVECSAVRSS